MRICLTYYVFQELVTRWMTDSVWVCDQTYWRSRLPWIWYHLYLLILFSLKYFNVSPDTSLAKILTSFFFVMDHLFSFLVKPCGVIVDSTCDVCELGKNKHFFYPPNLNRSRSFKIVLSDVSGPSMVVSLSYRHWFVTFISC